MVVLNIAVQEMNGLVLKLCNINKTFLEMFMTPVLFQVLSSVQSPAAAASRVT